MAKAEDLSGIVLAGGKSSRLGYDKARIAQPDGRPLIAHTVNRLAQVCREVLVVADRIERFLNLDLPAPIVSDFLEDTGPLGGIYTALGSMRFSYGLVVACDMPFLNQQLLLHMASLPRDYQALVPEFQGRLHPLHAIYAQTAFPVIDDFLQGGGRQVMALLDRLEVRRLNEEHVRSLDPQGYALFNLNTPEDIEQASAIRQELNAASPGGA